MDWLDLPAVSGIGWKLEGGDGSNGIGERLFYLFIYFLVCGGAPKSLQMVTVQP